MKEKTMRFAAYIKHAALWLCAITFGFFILLQVILWGGILWLNASKGQEWLQSQVTAALAESGYDARFDELSYNPAAGFTLKNLELHDSKGPFLTMKGLSLRPHVLGIAARNLSFSAKGQDARLHRLPENATEKSQAKWTPFESPDIYFRKIRLDSFSIDRLSMDESIAGQELLLKPDLSFSLSLRQKMAGSIALKINQLAEEPLEWLPARIAAEGEIDPAAFELAFQTEAVAPLYDIKARGKAGLAGNFPLDIVFSGQLHDLQKISPEMSGEGDFSGMVTGTVENPALSAEGTAAFAILTQNGFSDASWMITAQNLNVNPSGKISLQSSYLQSPVTLAAEFLYDAPTLTFSDINGASPELAVSGDIGLNTVTRMMQGEIIARAENLAAYSALIDAPVAGKASLTAALSAQEGRQRADLDISLSEASYDGITLASAKGKAHIPDIMAPWPTALDISMHDLHVPDGMEMRRISMEIRQKGGKEEDKYSLSVNGSGHAAQNFTLGGTASLTGLRKQAPAARDMNLTITAKESRINLSGDIHPGQIDATVTARDFPLHLLSLHLPAGINDAAFSGKADFHGTPALPEIDADLTVTPVTLAERTPSIIFSLKGKYRDKAATLSVRGEGQDIRHLSAEAALPVTLSLFPFVFDYSAAAPLNGKAAFDFDIAPVARAFLPPAHIAEGRLNGQAKIQGILPKPQITGTLALKNGTYIYDPYGVNLQDISAAMSFENDTFELTQLSAHDGATGKLSGSGALSISSRAATDVGFEMENFHLLRSQKADGIISASLKLRGKDKGYILGGRIKPERIDVIIPETFQTSIPALNIVTPESSAEPTAAMKSIALDIIVEAENQIFIRGWGLDAELGGTIDIGGQLDDPQFNGAFKALRGRYEEFGRRFDIKHANLRFQGSVPPSPYLDIEARTETSDITASIFLTGTIQNPNLKLSSVPAFPQDEILARLLFGRDMTRITPLQAIRLAQMVKRFSGQGGGGFDPLGKLRSATGIDDIQVDTDREGHTNVGIGKRLNDKAYLQIKKGEADTSGAASVKVELTPSITIDSEIGQDAQAGAGISWHWDY